MEENEMDSLFEGMELFMPSQFTVADADEPIQDPAPTHHHLPPPPECQSNPQAQVDDSTSTPNINDNSNIVTASTTLRQQQEPLDENLFSDLTLVTPLQTLTSDPTPNASTSTSTHTPTTTISRQISRKKRRATGLRIGYGRDPSFDELPSDPPLSSPSNPDDAINNQNQNLNLNLNPYPSPIDDGNEFDNAIISQSHFDAQSTSLPTPTVASDDIVLDASRKKQTSSSSSSKDENLSQYDRIKAQISEKLMGVRELAASVSASRKDSIRRRRKAADDLNLASAKHRDLELQLENACEAEDFVAAEKISECLAAAEKERDALLNALKDAEAHSDTIVSNMQDVLDCQIATEQESASLLNSFSKDAEKNADLVVKCARALSSEDMDDWISSAEALEAKKIELDIESYFINEARLVVNDSINHSIEDDRKEREILCKKKDILSDELQQLLALVKEKEKEIAENDAKIKAVEERIAFVVCDFQESRSSIDAKFDNLHSALSLMHLQSEALSTKRMEIENFLIEEEAHGAKLRELAKVAEDEARAYQEVVELRQSLKLSILKSREDKMRLAKTEAKLTEDVQMLQQEVFVARAFLQELSSTKSNIQQQMSSFKQRIFFTDKRVPELEAEKKVAAAARNFKEAARIAAEAKSLSVEKDGVQIDLEKATSELEKLEEDIKDTVSRLQDTEGLILSKEKEVAMTRFQRLLLIAGAATAEKFAALELGDTEEANLLLAEAESANAEAEKLEPMYNFKQEEFANLPKHFISMELVSSLGGKQLAELAASVDFSAP